MPLNARAISSSLSWQPAATLFMQRSTSPTRTQAASHKANHSARAFLPCTTSLHPLYLTRVGEAVLLEGKWQDLVSSLIGQGGKVAAGISASGSVHYPEGHLQQKEAKRQLVYWEVGHAH